jgi:hypothetical protein
MRDAAPGVKKEEASPPIGLRLAAVAEVEVVVVVFEPPPP